MDPIFLTTSKFSLAKTTLLLILFARPVARQGPATAEMLGA